MRIPPQQFFIILLCMFPIFLFAQEDKATQHSQLEKTNLLMIEGGTFNMGQYLEKYIVKRVTVSAFYIDATEVTNKEYRAFLNWHEKHSSKAISEKMLPDTDIWLRCTAPEISAQLAKDYFRLPVFDYYPVVGVSWIQAKEFVAWRSDRHNEQIAVEKGYWTAELQDKYAFKTSAFLAGDYHKKEGKVFPKNVNLILSNYRLLSEAEWEYTAWALIGQREYTAEGTVQNQTFEHIKTEGKEKHHKKAINKYRKIALLHAKKHPLPNYYDTKKYNLPKSVFEGDINSYGIFNLNDNVSEWVQDAYRSVVKSKEEIDVNQPAPNVERGTNVDEIPVDKISTIEMPFDEVLAQGKAANKNRIKADDPSIERVYKGASIVDPKGKKSPGNRSAAKAGGAYERLIGFRCGMTKVDMSY